MLKEEKMLNLYEVLLEHIDYDRLIEEGKDPREVLHYKFQNVPSDVIDSIIEIDPTKKKSYTQWTLTKWGNESEDIIKALDNGKLEKLFLFFKEHNEKQIKDCPSVKEGIDAYVQEEDEDTVLGKSSEPETYVLMLEKHVDSDLANDFDIVFNEDDWLIAVPNTYEAACKLGENCWWCTANHYGNGRGYYDEYLRKGGKYYINFDLSQGETLDDKTRKEYPYTRYQFHFESNQFKAATRNEPDVTFDDIDIPDSAKEFYVNEGKDLDDLEGLEVRMERYEERRYQDSIGLSDNGWEVYLNVEYDDDFQYEEPDLERSDWYVFSENDDRDPISWTEVDPHIEESLVYSSNDDTFIIKTKRWEEDDEKYLLISDKLNTRRWSSWEAIEISKFFSIDEIGGLLVVDDGKLLFLSSSSERKAVKLDFNEADEIKDVWVNPNIEHDKNSIYVELECDDNFHALLEFGQDGSVDFLIKRDIPIDGKQYFEENGVIRGVYREHNIEAIWENYFDNSNIHFVEELDDDIYLVEKNIKGQNRYGDDEWKTKRNVMFRGSNDVLFEEWADDIWLRPTYYELIFNEIHYLYSLEGERISRGYRDIKWVNKEDNLMAGFASEDTTVDLIDANSCKVVFKLGGINSNQMPINNRVIVTTLDDHSKVFDLKTLKFVFPEFQNEKRLFNIGSIVFCEDSDENFLIDFANDDGLEVKVDDIWRTDDAYKVSCSGKYNIITSNGEFIVPEWCDEIVVSFVSFCNDNDSYYKKRSFIVYRNSDKYYFYCPGTHENIFPNVEYILSKNIKTIPARGVRDFTFKNDDDTINVSFDLYSKIFNNWVTSDGQRGYMNYIETVPTEVVKFVRQFYTNEPLETQEAEQETVPAVAEQFKHMLNRINEASNKRLKTIYD